MIHFFNDKFEEILNFLEKNKELIQNNEVFKNMVVRKASRWVALAELLSSSQTTIQNINSVADLKGEIQLQLNNINKKITILPTGASSTGKNDMKITPEGILEISKLCELFDAKVVDIK